MELSRMHLTLTQLIELLDGRGGELAVLHVEQCSRCGMLLDELIALRNAARREAWDSFVAGATPLGGETSGAPGRPLAFRAMPDFAKIPADAASDEIVETPWGVDERVGDAVRDMARMLVEAAPGRILLVSSAGERVLAAMAEGNPRRAGGAASVAYLDVPAGVPRVRRRRPAFEIPSESARRVPREDRHPDDAVHERGIDGSLMDAMCMWDPGDLGEGARDTRGPRSTEPSRPVVVEGAPWRVEIVAVPAKRPARIDLVVTIADESGKPVPRRGVRIEHETAPSWALSDDAGSATLVLPRGRSTLRIEGEFELPIVHLPSR